ncbi:MAG: hypothetical protein NVS3B2_17990 [Ramlibacter sp.]
MLRVQKVLHSPVLPVMHSAARPVHSEIKSKLRMVSPWDPGPIGVAVGRFRAWTVSHLEAQWPGSQANEGRKLLDSLAILAYASALAGADGS